MLVSDKVKWFNSQFQKNLLILQRFWRTRKILIATLVIPLLETKMISQNILVKAEIMKRKQIAQERIYDKGNMINIHDKYAT